MRVCIKKADGKLIEMQSHATAGTLIQNAINTGYAEADIEEKEVTQAEYKAILDAIPKEPQPKSQIEILQETIDMLIIFSLGV